MGTVERDIRNEKQLQNLDWRVLTYWECEIKNVEAIAEIIAYDFNINDYSIKSSE